MPKPCHARHLDALDRRLIDLYQRQLPLVERPFAAMAATLGIAESEVLERLTRLQTLQVLSRVGPVFDHARAGASLLAAVAAPQAQRETFAELINAAPGVNHNYAREDYFREDHAREDHAREDHAREHPLSERSARSGAAAPARPLAFNLWFVMTAPDDATLTARLDALEARLGLPILRLPMLEGFHIDLGFPIPWHELEDA